MYAPDPNEKWDFENLDVRLYLHLKKLLPYAEAEYESLNAASRRDNDEDCNVEAEKLRNFIDDAEKTMRDFNASFGPVPDWATERNHGRELVAGAQLFTKNGRRCGNGWIVETDYIAAGPVAVPVFKILTDAGSFMQLTEKELEDAFEVGDWISTRERIIRDFDRNKEFQPHGN